jgi:hypothetical protein
MKLIQNYSMPMFISCKPDVVLSDTMTADKYYRTRMQETGIIEDVQLAPTPILSTAPNGRTHDRLEIHKDRDRRKKESLELGTLQKGA